MLLAGLRCFVSSGSRGVWMVFSLVRCTASFCPLCQPFSSPCCACRVCFALTPCYACCAAGPDAQACGQHQRGTHSRGAAPHCCAQPHIQHMAGRPGGRMQCIWGRMGGWGRVGGRLVSTYCVAARLAVPQISCSGRPAALCRASAATSPLLMAARRPTDNRWLQPAFTSLSGTADAQSC
jgi:hypothetical protein